MTAAAVVVAVAVLIGTRGHSDTGAGEPVATGANATPAATSVPPRAAQTPQISLPVPVEEVEQITDTARQVALILTNKNLSSAQQNAQTAALATGNLVLANYPPPTVTSPLDPVVVNKFEYMSTDQVQVKVSAGSTVLFLTFVPTGAGWKVDDVSSNGCATGAACPFDPAPLPSLTGSDS